MTVNFNPTGNSTNDYNSGYGVSAPCILLDEVNGTLWVAGIASHGLASSKPTWMWKAWKPSST